MFWGCAYTHSQIGEKTTHLDKNGDATPMSAGSGEENNEAGTERSFERLCHGRVHEACSATA